MIVSCRGVAKQATGSPRSRSFKSSDEHSGSLEGEFVREFPDLPRVEGIAIAGDRFFYVTDEDEGVHLRLTRLLAD